MFEYENFSKSKDKLLNFMHNEKERCIIILSSSGIGKTSLCNEVLRQFDVKVIRPFFENYSSHKEFVSFLENSLKTKDILTNKERILFLDDIDVLLSNDRYAMSYIQTIIQRINTDHLSVKLIMTCTSKEERKLCDLKRKMSIIKLLPPTFEECRQLIKSYIKKNKIQFNCDNSINSYILSANYNPRTIINNLFFYKTNPSHDALYNSQNLFEICQHILDNPEMSFNQLHMLLSTDPTLISYIIYDNFKNFVHRYYDINDDYVNCLKYVMNSYVHSSILESFAYNSNSWSNIEGANLIKCGSIKILQNTMKKKRIKKGKKIKEQQNEEPLKLNYTTITTRSSQHYSNKKKLNKLVSSLDIDFNQAMLLTEVLFIKSNNNHCNISFENNLMNLYINNICDKTINPFSRRCRVLRV